MFFYRIMISILLILFVNLGYAKSYAYIENGEILYLSKRDKKIIEISNKKNIISNIKLDCFPNDLIVDEHKNILIVHCPNANIINVIDLNSKKVTRKIYQNNIYTILFSQNYKNIYAINLRFNELIIIDTSSWKIKNVIKHSVINRQGTYIYKIELYLGLVNILDANNFRTMSSIKVGKQPKFIAITPSGKKVLVSNYLEETVSIIDTEKKSVIKTISIGEKPNQIVINTGETKSFVYGDENTMWSIDLKNNEKGWTNYDVPFNFERAYAGSDEFGAVSDPF